MMSLVQMRKERGLYQKKKKILEGGESGEVTLDIPTTLAEDIHHVPHQATEASARENPNALPVDEHS